MSVELKKYDTRLTGETPEVRRLNPANAPFYLPIGDEVEIFTAAYQARLPVLLKGPTGCGKTRFVEHMAHQLGRPLTVIKDRGETDSPGAPEPLTGHVLAMVTVACHEDLTASD